MPGPQAARVGMSPTWRNRRTVSVILAQPTATCIMPRRGEKQAKGPELTGKLSIPDQSGPIR